MKRRAARLRVLTFLILFSVSTLPVLLLSTWLYFKHLDDELSEVQEVQTIRLINIQNALENRFKAVSILFYEMVKDAQQTPEPKLSETLLYYANQYGIVDFQTRSLSPSFLNSSLGSALSLDANNAGRMRFSQAVSEDGETSVYLYQYSQDRRVFFAKMELNWLRELVNESDRPFPSDVIVTDQVGRALAHPNSDWSRVAKDLSYQPDVLRAIRGETGLIQYHQGGTDQEIISTYAPAPYSQWGIVIAQNAEPYIGEARSSFNSGLTLMGVLVVVCLILSWRLSGAFNRPIHALLEASLFIASGKEGIRVPYRKAFVDEFNQLSASFNRMAEQLDQQSRYIREQQESDKILLLQRVADNLPGMIFQSSIDEHDVISTQYLSYGLEYIFENSEKSTAIRVEELVASFDKAQLPDLMRTMKRSALEMKPFHSDIRIENPKGDEYWLSISGQPSVKNGQVHWDGVALDITDRKRAEAKMWRQANVDPVTQLYNRTAFTRELRHQCEADEKSLVLMFMDLDGFKSVNDRFGHSTGDALLIYFGHQLSNIFGQDEDAFLARIGGDEFCILGSSEEKLVRDANLLLKQLEKEVQIEGHDIKINVSIGVACRPEHGTDAETLLNHADAAMYYSKGAGGHRLSK